MTKQVPDADGFYTDYTLYYNPFTDEYICMFGDKDIYTPDVNSADWEGYTEEEAIEWFNSYEGLDDDQYIESSEQIEGAFGDKKKNQMKEIIEELFGDYRWESTDAIAVGVANTLRKELITIGYECTDDLWARIGRKLAKLPSEIESSKPSLRSVVQEVMKIANQAQEADVDTETLEDIRKRLIKLENGSNLGPKLIKEVNKAAIKTVPRAMRDALKTGFRDYKTEFKNN